MGKIKWEVKEARGGDLIEALSDPDRNEHFVMAHFTPYSYTLFVETEEEASALYQALLKVKKQTYD